MNFQVTRVVFLWKSQATVVIFLIDPTRSPVRTSKGSLGSYIPPPNDPQEFRFGENLRVNPVEKVGTLQFPLRLSHSHFPAPSPSALTDPRWVLWGDLPYEPTISKLGTSKFVGVRVNLFESTSGSQTISIFNTQKCENRCAFGANLGKKFTFGD